VGPQHFKKSSAGRAGKGLLWKGVDSRHPCRTAELEYTTVLYWPAMRDNTRRRRRPGFKLHLARSEVIIRRHRGSSLTFLQVSSHWWEQKSLCHAPRSFKLAYRFVTPPPPPPPPSSRCAMAGVHGTAPMAGSCLRLSARCEWQCLPTLDDKIEKIVFKNRHRPLHL